ncbi:MAG: hypothetical protein ACE5KZ_02575 [Candidatus Scalinduaceae bacterium]
MIYHIKRNERRVCERLERTLPITLLDHKVKSKNISSRGIYFETIASDVEKYLPGKAIMVEVEATASRPGLPERKIKLAGIGEVIRLEEIDNNECGNKLGVALKFSEKLKVYF